MKRRRTLCVRRKTVVQTAAVPAALQQGAAGSAECELTALQDHCRIRETLLGTAAAAVTPLRFCLLLLVRCVSLFVCVL